MNRRESEVAVGKMWRAARLALAISGMAVALVAMSQPSAAEDGAKSVEAAGAPAAAAAPDAEKVAKGKIVFANYGCGSCHSLADAGATGRVGPSFDGNSNLTEAFIANRVTNGQGVMPAFGDQLTPDEVAQVAAYVNTAAGK